MKEKMMKLGVLATALVLAFVFAACAQPTEEVGVGTPAIIRLYLDRPEHKTLIDSDTITLKAGEELDSALGANEADRLKAVYAGGAGVFLSAGTNNATNLETTIPGIPFFSSGDLILADVVKGGGGTAGVPIAVSDKAQYYVDIELINLTENVLEKGSSLSEGLSLYLELTVTTGGGGMATGDYLYTPDMTVFNEYANGAFLDTNSNIQRVDISAGINEIYLSQFARGNEP